MNPEDYQTILDELSANDNTISKETKLKLAYKAFHHTAEYDHLIQDYLSGIVVKDNDDLPEVVMDRYTKK